MVNDPPDWDGGRDEELQMLMQQVGCDRETIIKALDKTNGDMAKAICWTVEETNMIHRINWPVSSIFHNRL